ncbi:MAG: hemerythrin domain-containing protein [Burkholderiaceae bacterium]
MATANKTASKAAPKAGAKTDALSLLTQDHAAVKALFKKYEQLCKQDADGADKQAVAMEICAQLTAHATVEEEIFYPAARSEKTDDLLDEAEVEHASAKDLIAQIEGMEPEDDLYDAKVTVLGEYIDHHVKEEEGEMFTKVKALKLDLEELGAQMQARKEELLADLDS